MAREQDMVDLRGSVLDRYRDVIEQVVGRVAEGVDQQMPDGGFADGTG